MITAVQRKLWADDLRRLTVEMLGLLESEQQMDELDEIEGEREQLVTKIFSGMEFGEAEDGAWIGVLQEVQLLNQQLIGKSIVVRDSMSHELLTLMRAKKAGSAYATAIDHS